MKNQQLGVLALAGMIVLAGCGGGGSITGGCTSNCGGGGGGGTPTITMAAKNKKNLQNCGGASYTYAATASSGGITWSLDNANLGTINATTGVVTADCSTNFVAGVTGNVVATSTTDSSVSAKSPVTLVNQVVYNLGGATLADVDTWVANADGTDAAKILSNGCINPNYFAGHVAYACNGNYEADNNQAQIFSVDGAEPATLTTTLTFPTLENIQYVTPSPDGKLLLFKAYDPKATKWGDYTANADGTNLQALLEEAVCTGGCLGISQAHWNHAGTLIVYDHIVNDQYTLWTMNADGSNKTQLVTGGISGVFDAEDKTIYFDNGVNIYSVPVSGGDPTLWKSGVLLPTQSPDGTKIAYSVGISVWVANTTDGSDPQQILTGTDTVSW